MHMPKGRCRPLTAKTKAKTSLRHAEYYDMQEVFDKLYAQSKAGKNFTDLYDLIINPPNIMLAYRNIKANTGSKTAGVNGKTISDWKLTTSNDYVEYVQRRLNNYFPHKVKRVEIPKPNGKTRPLGIPTIEDRLIQQCIKQILEPILEAKFYPYSYGFRPNRDTTNAIAEFYRKVNWDKLYYVVDVDIKGFFDNVNHGKLLKQLWALGIRDKRVLSIISKILKAEIDKEGVPTKGTPQGGILSPLLANVVLNELDWWVDAQWKSFEIKERTPRYTSAGVRDRGNEYAKMRSSTRLKEMYIIRYADDFKIFCRKREDAFNTFNAVKAWLEDRLGLEISPEKSKVTDLRRQPSEFLGFNIKAVQKGDKIVAKSHLSDKTKDRIVEKIRTAIHLIRESPTPQRVSIYNSIILGQQAYYSMATEVSSDFASIEHRLYSGRANQLKGVMKVYKCKTDEPKVSKAYQKFYGKYNYKRQYVAGICLFPVPAVKFKKPIGFNRKICDYTPEGRKYIHDNLRMDTSTLHYLMQHTPEDASAELADNRLSLYSAQMGKCAATGEILQIGNMHLHHKTPKSMGGTDEYRNLVWVTVDVHHLIHATDSDTIRKYLSKLNLSSEAIATINKLRELAGNAVIK